MPRPKDTNRYGQIISGKCKKLSYAQKRAVWSAPKTNAGIGWGDHHEYYSPHLGDFDGGFWIGPRHNDESDIQNPRANLDGLGREEEI